MPYYYDTARTTTTNGTGNTLSTHMRYATVSQNRSCALVAMYGTARSGTAGGGSLQIRTAGTIGSGGTAQTPAPRNTASPASQVTAFNDATAITAGATPTIRMSIGIAQTGGMGGWVAVEPDDAVQLAPNGGANGNAEVASLANAASVAFDVTVEIKEA